MELYLHYPFCEQKCKYCDFLSAPGTKDIREQYKNSLISELNSSKKSRRIVDTVFIGGGTPSIMEAREISEVMDAVQRNFIISKNAEITVECNPKTVTSEKLKAMKTAGVNRLSFGLQSVHQNELQLLGRIHTFEDFTENYQMARKLGFENINVDLMYSLPYQKLSDWEDTIQTVLSLETEHISAYSLIIEEGTPFYGQYHEDLQRRESGKMPIMLPTEETERKFYEITTGLLSHAGYGQYEFSNYAKETRACRHNIGYWRGEEYLGFGLGASSYFDCKRIVNQQNLRFYLAGDFSNSLIHDVSEKEAMEEFLFLGLRMTEGVSEQDFFSRFHKQIKDVFYKPLLKMKSKRLLIESGGRYYLSQEGILISNYVLSHFLL